MVADADALERFAEAERRARSGDGRRALALYVAAAKAGNAAAWLNAGLIVEEDLGDASAAQNLFRRGFEAGDDRCAEALAASYYRQGRYGEAAGIFASLGPLSVEASDIWASVEYKLGHYEHSLEIFNSLERPGLVGYADRAIVTSLVRSPEEALQDLEQDFNAPGDPDYSIALLGAFLSRCAVPTQRRWLSRYRRALRGGFDERLDMIRYLKAEGRLSDARTVARSVRKVRDRSLRHLLAG